MISIIPAIKSLKIRNLGPVRRADLRFDKGINIIFGPSGKGKTAIINAISHMLKGEKLLYDPNKDKKKSEKAFIEIELFNKKMSVEVKKQASIYEECLHKRMFPNGKRIPWTIYSAQDLEQLKARLSKGSKTFTELNCPITGECYTQ